MQEFKPITFPLPPSRSTLDLTFPTQSDAAESWAEAQAPLLATICLEFLFFFFFNVLLLLTEENSFEHPHSVRLPFRGRMLSFIAIFNGVVKGWLTSWMRNVPHRLGCFNTCYPVGGAVWKGYGAFSLQEAEPCWRKHTTVDGLGELIIVSYFLFSEWMEMWSAHFLLLLSCLLHYDGQSLSLWN